MGDLRDARLIYAKGFLFLAGAALASALILAEHPSWRLALLLGLALWCACRFYYFAFYVIEHYVDGRYRFAGLWDFAGYLLRRRAAMDLDAAIALATKAHAGAVDKGGRPYIEHPLRVMDRVSGVPAKMAAVLHDVLEDTDVTAADLLALGCPPEVVAAVEALSKRDGESYEAFVARAARDPIARQVKRADLLDNADEGRLALLPPEQAARLREKYRKGLAALGEAAP